MKFTFYIQAFETCDDMVQQQLSETEYQPGCGYLTA